jgi:heme oxygenase
MPRTDAALSVTIRDRLRNASAASHAAVDARFAPLLDGGEARYSEFLVASAAGVIPLETSLEAAGVATYLPDWAARSRASALRADLRDFGRAPAEGERVPALRGEAMVYGALYVLEGSRLGARVLVRRALASPSARVRAATRYLAHGEPGLWNRFLVHLEASQAVRRAIEEAIAGAEIAFGAFGSGMPAGERVGAD